MPTASKVITRFLPAGSSAASSLSDEKEIADGTPGALVGFGVADGASADGLGAAEDAAVEGDARAEAEGVGDGATDGEDVACAIADGVGEPDPPNPPTTSEPRTTPTTTATTNTTPPRRRGEPVIAQLRGGTGFARPSTTSTFGSVRRIDGGAITFQLPAAAAEDDPLPRP